MAQEVIRFVGRRQTLLETLPESSEAAVTSSRTKLIASAARNRSAHIKPLFSGKWLFWGRQTNSGSTMLTGRRSRSILITFLAASAMAGCGLGGARSDGPDWTISDAKPPEHPDAKPAETTEPKKFALWDGPNAPQPLTYDNAAQRDAAAPMAVGSTADMQTVVVAPGDTLATIAKRHGVTVKAMLKANSLTNDRIVIGQQLSVPPRP